MFSFGYRYGIHSCCYHSSSFLFFSQASSHWNILSPLVYVTQGQQKVSSLYIRDLGGNIRYLFSIGTPMSHSTRVWIHKNAKTAAVGKKLLFKCIRAEHPNLGQCCKHLLDLDVTAKLLDWQSLSNDPQGSHIPSVSCLQLPKDHPPSSCLGFHDSLKICSKHSC